MYIEVHDATKRSTICELIYKIFKFYLDKNIFFVYIPPQYLLIIL